MFYLIAGVLLALWLVGMLTAYTFGGFIHILLAVALIALVFRIVSGPRQHVVLGAALKPPFERA